MKLEAMSPRKGDAQLRHDMMRRWPDCWGIRDCTMKVYCWDFPSDCDARQLDFRPIVSKGTLGLET